ncbi:hypothetical protein LF1_56170 [Rubripirellula obstinata]|uniref:Uncharacterized protein n=1 Tax=Rubripirellula obstinata TaxID=406547 RepID=A0A5B1CAQ1_9BACT|nr:hypothetical protein [Rubripirellula obstinata]KAA1257055.1 hypothetical protein LF1_56170 [Rubripirellula obstinata]
MFVTHGDEVRADGPYRNGVLRITIACTGVAVADFSLCLHVNRRHLGDAYRYPTEPRTFTAFLAPCGAYPTPDLHRSGDCPAGHQPTPDFQCSNNADVLDALRGINQRLSLDTRFNAANRNLLDRSLFATIYTR